jgi:hypothetical protein
MSKHSHMLPVPPANLSYIGPGDDSETANVTSKMHVEVNTLEQGDTANVKQNTTDKGFFKGRRVKQVQRFATNASAVRCTASMTAAC